MTQLFHPFTQADSTITRKFGGTGLGLSICKRLTTMMNGDITVTSKDREGSTFSFTIDLPAVRRAQAHVPQPNKAPATTSSSYDPERVLKILLVDDTLDNRDLIKAFLKNTPHILVEAENGHKAVALYKTETPDLILMDMQMPIMDGAAATIEIRTWEHAHNLPAIPIWALSANALKEEVDKSLHAGCNLHLVKPLKRQDLLNHLRDLNR